VETKKHGERRLNNIFELAILKGRSVRELRTMLYKGQLTHYKLGWRTILFDPEQFDRDIEKFKVKAVTDRNGRGR
jgi:hypothetical protein